MFSLLKKSAAPQKTVSELPDQIILEDAPDIIIRLKPHARARRFTLRQDIKNGGFVLSGPKRMTLNGAMRFINQHRAWIDTHHIQDSPMSPFQADDVFYFYDHKLNIINDCQRLRGLPEVCMERGLFIVPGAPENLHRKTTDFLKDHFRTTISEMAHDKAQQIGKTIKRIRIADQKTRWGSCSTTGTLSFSCRLVFAPLYVVDYVAAHEVAHMVHMDHSTRFWALCRELCEDGARMEAAKHWLKTRNDIYLKYQL